MKVLHIHASPNRGGSQKHTLLLCRELHRLGVFAAIACPGGEDYEKDIRESGITCVDLPSPQNQNIKSTVKRLCEIIQKQRYDLIHLHELRAEYWGWRVGRKFRNIPILTTVHNMLNYGPIPSQKRFVYRWLFKFMSRRFDRILCVSEFNRQNTIKYFGLNDEKCVTIHNGVELEEIENTPADPQILIKWGLDPGKPIVGVAGRMVHGLKGMDIFLRAMADVAREAPDCQFLIAGDGPDLMALKAIAKELSLTERVFFVGWSSNLISVMKSSTVWCMTSRWESLPRVMLEAMAAGCPVVATDVGGVREVILDQKNGVIIPPEDPNALAKAVTYLLKNRKAASDMARTGRTIIASHFTSSIHAEKTLKVYKEVLGIQ